MELFSDLIFHVFLVLVASKPSQANCKETRKQTWDALKQLHLN